MYLLYFFFFLAYNYNGDTMNRDSIILTVKSMNDIEKLKYNNKIKYLNIDLIDIDKEAILYLKEKGKKYLYADSINNKNGYIYVDYDTFIKGEKIINDIILNIPIEASDIEIAKYLYVNLGKRIGYDINSVYEKNENFNFEEVSVVNNIWSSIVNGKGTNQSYCKLYLYLCSLFNINCEIVTVNTKGYLCNKITINGKHLIVDLTKDAAFIQANFKTRYFSNYNDELELDKNISYINDIPIDIKLDKKLKKIDYDSDDVMLAFLESTQDDINISKIKPIELGIIYDLLFKKYLPDLEIKINNLYINCLSNIKKHFILITYNNNHYSYNYNKHTFMKIEEQKLLDNLKSEKIGLYLDEDVPINI